MTHDLATRNQAPARYLLGELSPAERDEFEEHYFDCPDCAQEVHSGAVLRANTRAVLGEAAATAQPSSVRAVRWWQKLFTFDGPVLAPYGVAAALLLVSGYQNLVVIPGLRSATEPQLVASAAL